jgi:hypothetical protein
MKLETGNLKFEIWIALLLAAATLAGNGEALWRLARNAVVLRNSWEGRGYRSSGDHVDLPRQIIERYVAPDASCGYLRSCCSAKSEEHTRTHWHYVGRLQETLDFTSPNV